MFDHVIVLCERLGGDVKKNVHQWLYVSTKTRRLLGILKPHCEIIIYFAN